jgi:hypothetical protein
MRPVFPRALKVHSRALEHQQQTNYAKLRILSATVKWLHWIVQSAIRRES